MPRPYALLRASFPHVTSVGGFVNTSMPRDIAIGKEGRLYALCTGNAGPIAILNLEDEDLGSFGAPGFGFRLPSYKCNQRNRDWPVQDGALLWHVQIIVDRDEILYISDQGTDRITIYDRFGEYLGKWGEHGSSDGQLDRPSGIAFDYDENMYVVDTMNHRVQQFTKNGVFLNKFGSYGTGDGELDMPWGIHVDELGDIYVVDWRNDRVQKFDSDGNFIFKLGSSGTGDGQFNRPSGIAVDRHGDIYVADCGNDRVQLFSQEGRYVQKFVGDATMTRSTLKRTLTANKKYFRVRESAEAVGLDAAKFFSRPVSVRVDDEFRMYVADHWNFRFQVYQKEAYPLSEDEVAPPLRAASTGSA